MKIEKINFITEDKLNLFGILHIPELQTNEVVIFIHGIHSNCHREKDDIFSEELCKNNIAYFTFDNRGANTVTKISGRLYGSAYENPLECIYDIEAAIKIMKEKGYTKIHVLGHSLGSSKILYWYTTTKQQEIKTVGFLSLVDVSGIEKAFLGSKNEKIIEELKKQKLSALIPQEMFIKASSILPLSVGTFLKIFIEKEFNKISYAENAIDIECINTIKEPVFMRFGTINEYVTRSVPQTVADIASKTTKNNIDISYIENADHSYHGKEKQLINEYIKFIKNNQ